MFGCEAYWGGIEEEQIKREKEKELCSLWHRNTTLSDTQTENPPIIFKVNMKKLLAKFSF